jgi:hypothetical protein
MAEDQPGDLVDYRIYLLDRCGRIRTRRELRAASDECALQMLKAMPFAHTAEFWRHGRRIAALEASRAAN